MKILLRENHFPLLFVRQKKTSYEKEPILHLTQIQSARNGLTKSNEFSSKLNMKQPEIT